MVSLDGNTFANAQFPDGVQVINQAYTVVESPTRAIFLHVTTSSKQGHEWGTLFTSNSNGTYYTASMQFVNRDSTGFVDYERVPGLDGVAILNAVASPKEASMGAPKHAITKITYDSGGSWRSIAPPLKDVQGAAYDCAGDKDCHLHLHSYTEIQDPVNIFSASSAVGLLVGVGNVGKHLDAYSNADTFLSTDAGQSWKEIRKGVHLHRFGDHGALLVLVDAKAATDRILYSIDEGASFSEYYFTKDKVRVTNLLTEPASTSRRFILLGSVSGGNYAAYRIDFDNIEQRQCKLNMNNNDESDFAPWTPKDQENSCLFGHVMRYYRRKPERQCFIGHEYEPIKQLANNCTCLKTDFECAYNFVRQSDGTCTLASGQHAVTPACNKGQEYYFVPTGYSKLPKSTCEGEHLIYPSEQRKCTEWSQAPDTDVPNADVPKSSGVTSGVVFLVLFSVGAFVGLAVFMARDHRSAAQTATEYAETALHLGHGVVEWARFWIERIPIPQSLRSLEEWVRGARYTRLSTDEHNEVDLADYDYDDSARLL
jgi:hypothetical protein